MPDPLRHDRDRADSAANPPDLTDPQLILAADRTMLAMERTYAAWVRTGLAALASGVAARALLDSTVPMVVAGLLASLLIGFSGFCFFAAVYRELGGADAIGCADLRRMPRRVLIAANAVMILISLIALAGAWMVA